MNEPLLTFDRVSVAYDGVGVLRDVSFSLERGEVLGVVGESGGGKSTILKAALGLLGSGGQLTGGSIVFAGLNIATLDKTQMASLRGAQMGMVFQDCLASFTPTRTIGDLFYEEVSAHGSMKRSECEERAAEMLVNLELDDPERILSSYPLELSGGMGQRVGIALAMLLEPRLLLADEPTSALDVVSQKQVIEELAKIRAEKGTSILLATHNIGLVRALADTVIVLKNGLIAEQGSARDVLEHPQDAYTRQLIDAVPHLGERGAR